MSVSGIKKKWLLKILQRQEQWERHNDFVWKLEKNRKKILFNYLIYGEGNLLKLWDSLAAS